MCERGCPQCGLCFADIDMEGTRSLTYEDELNNVTSTVTYKRQHHFSEWLSKVQAKNATHLPNDVIQNILGEIKKNRMAQESMEATDMRLIMKKLKYGKYYDCIAYITSEITGKAPPTIPYSLEVKLKSMFERIQEPFQRNCPEGRKNFLSYSFVVHKFLEILGEDEFLPLFPLLKSSDKLYMCDCLWRQICQEVSWEFIRTV